MKKPFVYVAGAYRAPTVNGIAKNIARAWAVAVECWRLGFVTFCPHTNSAYMDGAANNDDFLIGGLDIMEALANTERGCVLVLVEGWLKSDGTCMEIEFARQKKIPVFDSVEELKVSTAWGA